MAISHCSRERYACIVLDCFAGSISAQPAPKTAPRTPARPSFQAHKSRAKAIVRLHEPVSLTGSGGAKHSCAEVHGVPHRADAAMQSCPCDHCPCAAMCCDLQLACRAFAQFVRGIEWRGTVRQPTHKRYLQLFASEACGVPSC